MQRHLYPKKGKYSTTTKQVGGGRCIKALEKQYFLGPHKYNFYKSVYC